MSKFSRKAKLRTAHYISYSLLESITTWITVAILELIHAKTPDCKDGRIY